MPKIGEVRAGDLARAAEKIMQLMEAKLRARGLPPDPHGLSVSLLAISLSAAVPLNIMELEQKGGPDDADVDFCHAFAQTLGEKGDVLQFRGKKKGESAAVFNGLARALAIMAFCPGGVTFCGSRYAGKAT